MEKEQLNIARIADKIRKYEKTGEICHTAFLVPTEALEAKNMVRKIANVFCGGYEEAERKILIIGTDEKEVVGEYMELLTIELLTIEKNKKMSHREVLGSLLGLGITRDVIGDIIIKDSRADVFVLKEISKYIIQNLQKVGKEKVKIYINSYENLISIEDLSKEIKTTVASLRLDAIISVAIGVSREVSAKMIQNQKVKLNHKIIENTSKQIKTGDKISVRGYGRIELVEVLGETKKDRIRVILKKNT